MADLGYLALGVDEVQRLSHERGLDLDLNMAEIIGLGRTVYDRERAKHPNDDLFLSPVGLALLLQINWPDSLAEAQHRLDHELGQVHDHARLLAAGLDPGPHPDQVHAYGRGSGNGQDSHTAPEASLGRSSEVSDPQESAGQNPGAGRSRGARSAKGRVRNATIETADQDQDWRPI